MSVICLENTVLDFLSLKACKTTFKAGGSYILRLHGKLCNGVNQVVYEQLILREIHLACSALMNVKVVTRLL